MKFFILLVSLSSLVFSLNFEITHTRIANGATSLVEFPKDKDISYKKITFGKRSYNIYESPLKTDKMYALLPVSYYKKPAQTHAKVHYVEDNQKKVKSIALQIKDGNYKKEKITVSKSKVNPKGKAVNKRISQEYHEAMKIYATSTKNNLIKSEFILPMNSFITSDFGKARVYNDTLKGYHSGTDFRAKVGTPIKASNDGVVVLSKDRFYSGGTVLLDHGHGVYTCYYHLSQLGVKVGQKVLKSDIIGLSGDTGRVTGPHLHFSVRVGGVQVDPLQFVELMNTKLLKQEEKKI